MEDLWRLRKEALSRVEGSLLLRLPVPLPQSSGGLRPDQGLQMLLVQCQVYGRECFGRVGGGRRCTVCLIESPGLHTNGAECRKGGSTSSAGTSFERQAGFADLQLRFSLAVLNYCHPKLNKFRSAVPFTGGAPESGACQEGRGYAGGWGRG